MNEQNLEYLKDNIKYMGFGEKLYSDLEAGLKSGAPEFQLKQSTEIHKKPFDVTLNFRKSDNKDLYFFNSYHASLKHTNGETKDQVFYLNKGKGITAKEAYNLLDGRAVFKELANKAGASYKAWIQLDFEKRDKNNNHEIKQYHEAYGYDLKAALSKYSIAEMDGGEKEKALLQSLAKGNIQAVGIEREGGITKMFVEAAPQFKSINLYDSGMKRVPKESLEQHQKKEVAPQQKQAATDNIKQKASKGLEGQKRAPGQAKSRSSSI